MSRTITIEVHFVSKYCATTLHGRDIVTCLFFYSVKQNFKLRKPTYIKQSDTSDYRECDHSTQQKNGCLLITEHFKVFTKHFYYKLKSSALFVKCICADLKQKHGTSCKHIDDICNRSTITCTAIVPASQSLFSNLYTCSVSA